MKINYNKENQKNQKENCSIYFKTREKKIEKNDKIEKNSTLKQLKF